MASAPSTKRLLIDKANARIVLFVSVAAFVVIFSLVATKTLISQAAYQNRVIGAKKAAVKQLTGDIASLDKLRTSYNAFNGTVQNVLGGNPQGTGAQDGSNAQIVIDALPSSYDFPGLTTSLESLLATQKVQITSISGTDDEVAQSAKQSSGSPAPVAMPFQVVVSGSYGDVQNVIGAFEHSIRPIQVKTMDISGSNGKLTLTISAETYYQPAKSLGITKTVVK